MLSDSQWAEFEHLCNGDYLTQVDDAGFEAALEGVKLAVALLRQNEMNFDREAFTYVAKFGNWRKIPFSPDLRRKFYVCNYGEEEVQAMEEAGEL